MKRLLYQIHRWAGIGLALFMFVWFLSGLVIMYAGPSALGKSEQLAHRELLNPEFGWLSLGEAWTRSTAQRPQANAIATDARLVRQAGQPLWLVEDNRGARFALSAVDGRVHETSADEAARIAAQWLAADSAPVSTAPTYLDTGIQDSAVRNHEALRPFHRFAVGDSGRELLISARTGEVVRDSTRFDRALYWTGNWIHLLRPLETAGLSADTRRTVLAWLGFIAFAACLTGLIIGWQRWRPGWGGRPTYSQGRKQPYREFWFKYHFWAGLLGGSAALLWALSGYLSNNPFQLFSPAAPNREELARYQGAELPAAMRDWRPSAFVTADESRRVVELAWRRLGDKAVLVAQAADGSRTPHNVDATVSAFDATTLARAAERLAPGSKVATQSIVNDYDSYYYPRHHQGAVERPLPVVRVDLDDKSATRLYIDPQDGRLLLRQDDSRRVYRWLYSALHHWDFGVLYQRPVWDAWMLVWVLLGVVLGASSLVIGWKRLRRTFETDKPKPKAKPGKPQTAGQPRLATDSPAS
ncbi:PepSY domain-containing protein [Zoogloea sp. LCSB751]|uniref:PepSY domain-containing protein n=1 Tax=Zoogloea sp. LCSB751 TaxID=1965277 RepID=UPI001C1F9D0A|nr:PepSY domain-containing protein [Zoogloea sp. LCSB751]